MEIYPPPQLSAHGRFMGSGGEIMQVPSQASHGKHSLHVWRALHCSDANRSLFEFEASLRDVIRSHGSPATHAGTFLNRRIVNESPWCRCNWDFNKSTGSLAIDSTNTPRFLETVGDGVYQYASKPYQVADTSRKPKDRRFSDRERRQSSAAQMEARSGRRTTSGHWWFG